MLVWIRFRWLLSRASVDKLIGNDAFQEADNVGISRPCTKHNVLVKDVNELAQTIKEAFYIAMSGCRGCTGRYSQGCEHREGGIQVSR